MIKTLSNKIYLKEQLFGLKMDPSKSLEENLDDFKVITIGLANIDENISQENQAIILLNSLPKSHKCLQTIIKYGRESLSLHDVLGALRSRDFEIKKEKKGSNSTSEGLQVRGRLEKKNFQRGKRNSRSRPREKKKVKQYNLLVLQEKGHIRRNCPSRKRG